jgi:hypothetical protein
MGFERVDFLRNSLCCFTHHFLRGIGIAARSATSTHHLNSFSFYKRYPVECYSQQLPTERPAGKFITNIDPLNILPVSGLAIHQTQYRADDSFAHALCLFLSNSSEVVVQIGMGSVLLLYRHIIRFQTKSCVHKIKVRKSRLLWAGAFHA